MPIQTLFDEQTWRAGGYDAKTAAACAYKVTLDHMPLTYPPELKLPITAFVQSLFDSGNAFEDTMFAAMAGPGVVEIVEAYTKSGERTAEGKAAVERSTFDAMCNPDVNIILGGRIGPVFERLLDAARGGEGNELDPSRISQPDVLILSDERDEHTGIPKFMIPVDVKDHAALAGQYPKHVTARVSTLTDPSTITTVTEQCGTVRQVDMMQLAHYYRHLQAIQLAGEPQGAIIGREKRLTWTWLNSVRFENPVKGEDRLDSLGLYDYWLDDYRDLVLAAQARDVDPEVLPISGPERQTDCAQCQWRAVCDEELTHNWEGGHITLLPGITPRRAKAHYAAGVESIRDLASRDWRAAIAIDAKAQPHEVPGTDPGTRAYIGTGVTGLAKAIRQARVKWAGKVARNVGVNVVDLRRADVEVDFDLENTSAPVLDTDDSAEGGLVYLWGTRTTRRRHTKDGVQTTVKDKPFYTWTDTLTGEAEAFARFWSFLTTSRADTLAKGKTWRAYHYTAHELTWWRKLAERHAGFDGVPTVDEVEDLIATGDIVDLYKLLTDQLVWPTENHSIKSLAKWARFSWRASDAGGDLSLVWYRDTVSGKVRERGVNKRRLLNYNVDDVAAQVHLRDWIDNLSSAEDARTRMPAVTDLRGPAHRRTAQVH